MSASFCKPKLVNFYIFDSRYGQKEGEEHEKLLYYFPAADTLNTKVRNIGLSEAFANFARKFNKKSDCETVHTQKHCTVMLQPEQNIWMVMKISLAWYIQYPESTSKGKSRSKQKNSRKKERKSPNKPAQERPNEVNTENEPPPSRQSHDPSTNSATNTHENVDETTSNIVDQVGADSSSINSFLSSGSHENILEAEAARSSSGVDNISTDSLDNRSCNDLIESQNDGSSEQQADQLLSSSLITTAEAQSSSQQSNECTVSGSRLLAPLEPGSKFIYDNDSVQTTVLKSHLKLAYDAFIFLHYSYAHLLKSKGLTTLRNYMLEFFNNYIKQVDLSCGTVGDVWRGLSYLPLSQPTFLQVYCCLSGLCAAVPAIKHTALLYKNSVVWCDFELETLRYLIHYLHYKGICNMLSREESRENNITSRETGYMDSFVGGIGGSTLIYVDCNNGSKSSSEDKKEKCHLILYKSTTVIIPIVLAYTEKLTSNLYEKLFHLLDSRVSQLTDILNEATDNLNAVQTNTNDNFKYIYHNAMNLAIKSNISFDKPNYQGPNQDSDQPKTTSGWWFSKSNLSTMNSNADNTDEDHTDGVHGVEFGGAFSLAEGNRVLSVYSNKGASATVPWCVMQSIVDMQQDMKRFNQHESVVKTIDDHWIIGKVGNNRELFVTLTQSSANLVEVTDEVNKQSSSQFSNVFMLD